MSDGQDFCISHLFSTVDVIACSGHDWSLWGLWVLNLSIISFLLWSGLILWSHVSLVLLWSHIGLVIASSIVSSCIVSRWSIWGLWVLDDVDVLSWWLHGWEVNRGVDPDLKTKKDNESDGDQEEDGLLEEACDAALIR